MDDIEKCSNSPFHVAELEINIKFPTCWDGVNTEARNGAKHVVYADECDGREHNECFDFDCPRSHPVKLPEIHLYVRVLEYEGGAHMFADGTDVSGDSLTPYCKLVSNLSSSLLVKLSRPVSI